MEQLRGAVQRAAPNDPTHAAARAQVLLRQLGVAQRCVALLWRWLVGWMGKLFAPRLGRDCFPADEWEEARDDFPSPGHSTHAFFP